MNSFEPDEVPLMLDAVLVMAMTSFVKELKEASDQTLDELEMGFLNRFLQQGFDDELCIRVAGKLINSIKKTIDLEKSIKAEVK